MTKRTYLPILLAGLLAAAGAQAQTTPSAGSSDGPPAAGEASTQTKGVPNAQTTNSPVTEASTVVQGKPNVDPTAEAARALSRQEVVAELKGRRALFEANRRAMLNPDARLGVAGGATTRQ